MFRPVFAMLTPGKPLRASAPGVGLETLELTTYRFRPEDLQVNPWADGFQTLARKAAKGSTTKAP